MTVSVTHEERVVHSRRPVDLGLTLGPLVHGGRRDPGVVIGPHGVWRASDTAAGPATVHLRSTSPTTVAARAWGPGAAAALAEVPELIGAADDPPSLAGAHPLVTELEKRMPGLRIGRTGAVLDAVVPTVLAQRVIGAEAGFAYVAMTRASGRAAPGPDASEGVDDGPGAPALLLPPEPGWLMATPYWVFHRWGVEHRRVATIKTAVSHALRLAEASRLPVGEARRRLFALPGVGPWTVNNVAMLALGDPDAVSVGDYWLKHVVCFALTGEARGTDERMLELLEPWRGQRGRVCRLLLQGARRPPRFGPRLPLRLIAAH
jgi:3-methyladenine DNA glycosylase/8-oxoguanine DNA glycosylase